jgi:hypothetical protein
VENVEEYRFCYEMVNTQIKMAAAAGTGIPVATNNNSSVNNHVLLMQ